MIGANIKRLRVQQGMTQKNLADKLFVSAQAVSRWENDEVEPSISTILEISKIFGVSVDEILGVETKEASADNKEENKEEKEDQRKSEEEPKEEKKREIPRQFLAVCEQCNSPIYESHEIVRTYDKVLCTKCHKRNEESKKNAAFAEAKKRRVLSLIFGSLGFLVFFILILSFWNSLPGSFGTKMSTFITPVSVFAFISCLILNNNFVGDMFLTVSSWSFRAPGLIFSFDVDGCLWFIATKILFAILGVIVGIVTFILALVLGCIVSIFVYPYAIIMNIKRPLDCYML